MKKRNWTATKREYSFDAEGNEIPDKITYEKIQKNWFDFTLKSIGAVAIFIPLLILFFQRIGNIELETSKTLSDLYTNVSTDLEIIISSDIGTSEFTTAYNNLLFKYEPKVQLFKNHSLDSTYYKLIAFGRLYKGLLSLRGSMDTIRKQRNLVDDLISKYSTKKYGGLENKDLIRDQKSIQIIINRFKNEGYQLNHNSIALVDELKEYPNKIINQRMLSSISDSMRHESYTIYSNVSRFKMHSIRGFNLKYFWGDFVVFTQHDFFQIKPVLDKQIDSNRKVIRQYRRVFENQALALIK